MLAHRSLGVGGRKARLDPGTANLDTEGSKGIAHGRSRGRAPVSRQGLTLPGEQTVNHVTVRALPARTRLLEERAHCARRFRRGLSRRLRLGLRLGLGSRACLAASLASSLAALSGQGALPTLGSQRLLAQLLVMGEGARVPFRGRGNGSRSCWLLLFRHPWRRGRPPRCCP